MRPLFSVITILVAGIIAWAQVGGYELRGEKKFENEIDSHLCKELFVRNRAVSWVSGATGTSIGVVARICKEVDPPFMGAASPGNLYGGVIRGWHIFDFTTGNASQLSLPGLGEFSNPSFCDQLVAYWSDSADSNYSLVVADLRTRLVVKKVPVGRLELATDYMYHLAPAAWDAGCTVATFNDERYIKETAIPAKSN